MRPVITKCKNSARSYINPQTFKHFGTAKNISLKFLKKWNKVTIQTHKKFLLVEIC